MKWNHSKLVLLMGICVFFLASCGLQSQGALGEIQTITREDGSGTRGAFTELTGILVKGEGTLTDQTTKTAVVQNNTEGVISTVKGDLNAIGYISLGSLNENVKALAIDGVEPTAQAVIEGTYPIQRPFNVAWKKGSLSPLAQDFLAFAFSQQGQAIVSEKKFIPVDPSASSYQASGLTGKLSIVGSTSVSPIIEKMAEVYQELNPGVTIDMTSNGSSAGMMAAIEGTADIGMASRALKEDELAQLEAKAIAMDGIAVIINAANPTQSIRLEQVRQIFTGQLTQWSQVTAE